MIGYDLDGVLISDLFRPIDLSLENFLDMRARFPYPNFVPRGKYVIVTGRNYSDYEYTLAWVRQNLYQNMPEKIFHDCPHHSQAKEYKAEVINQNGIKVFIESDASQVEYLKENCPNCKIIHFGEFINEALSNL